MIREFVGKWTHGEDWRTWIAHAVLALVLAMIVAVIPSLMWGVGMGAMVGGVAATIAYLWREVDQVFYRVVAGEELHPFDHVMDVAAPALATLPIAYLLYQVA